MGFSNERMRTAQLAGWFLLDGLELTPAGNPITQPQELPFGVDHLIGFNELLTCKHPESAGVHFFLDDYQFERFWRQPQRYLAALYGLHHSRHLHFKFRAAQKIMAQLSLFGI